MGCFCKYDVEVFLFAEGPSDVNILNFNKSDTSIWLRDSIAEFRHTLFIRQDETCPIQDLAGSTIYLQSVYVNGTQNDIVCQKPGTVVYGKVSGRTLYNLLFLQSCCTYKRDKVYI